MPVILTKSIIDALSLYQNGYPNVIPLYGTDGLTEDHRELFQTYRPKKIYLCLNDVEAAGRIGATLKEWGFNVGVVNLPDRQDVNDFFRAERPSTTLPGC